MMTPFVAGSIDGKPYVLDTFYGVRYVGFASIEDAQAYANGRNAQTSTAQGATESRASVLLECVYTQT